jgi:syntaxin-binding protein 5
VSFAGFAALEDRVIHIAPMDADIGSPAYASQSAVSGLRTGYKVNGVVVVTTISGAWIFKPATVKGAHKSWDQNFCDAASVTHVESHGYALVGLFGDGYAKAYSIPGLKEIGATKVSDILDVKRLSEAVVSPTGDVFGWTSPSEMAILNVWGTGVTL